MKSLNLKFIRIKEFYFIFIVFAIFGCLSPSFKGANEDSQAIIVTIEDLVKRTDTLDKYLIVMMPIWCSASKWLAQEKIAPLSDSLEANNIPYFFVVLGDDYSSVSNFVRKNKLNRAYYLIQGEWQGNGFLDRVLINKISRCLKVERRGDGVPFGFFLDKKNGKITYSVFDYEHMVSNMEHYNSLDE